MSFVNLHLCPHIVTLVLSICFNQINRIRQNTGIAIAVLVIVGQYALQVFRELRLLILRALPEPRSPHIQLLPIIHIVGILHLPYQLIAADTVVALEDNRVNLHLFARFHNKVDQHTAVLIFHCRIYLGTRGHRNICVTFLQIVSANTILGGCEQVFRHNVACCNFHLLAQLSIIALLHTS